MAPELGIKKVLIADDDPDTLSITRELFVRLGCEVVGVYDGEQLIARAVETQPDLLIVDVVLPKINGYQAVKRLIYEKSFIRPVLFWSAIATDAVLFREYKPSCPSAFMVKPMSEGTDFDAEMIEQIKALLDQ